MSEDQNKPAQEPITDGAETSAPDSGTISPDKLNPPAAEEAADAVAADTDPQSPPPAAAAPAGGKSKLAALALLLALGALGANFWIWQQLQGTSSSGSQLQSELANLRQDQAQSTARLAAVNSELQAAQAEAFAKQAREASALIAAKTDDLQRQLRQNREQVYELRQQIQSVSAADKRNWLLAEAEYLMRLASQRLLMSGDVAAAADMLQSADDVLQSLDDGGLVQIRAQLAEEVAALRTAARFDAEGLYLKLEGIAAQADKLRLFEPPALETAEPEIADSATVQEKLEAGIKRAWAKLSSYIVLQKRDQQYQRLIAPEQEASLRYSVRLMFEQAELALLAGNQTLYQRALTKAADWLEEYYVLDESTGRLVTQVRELSQQSVVSQVPDISGSLRSLKLYVEADNARRRTAS